MAVAVELIRYASLWLLIVNPMSGKIAMFPQI
jgi:hypothetical protein